ncbi:MAG: hypothetical protein PUD31_06985 [Solobacterium sp.]|nr:hypothetical protein [Solobacterium sp.]
MQLRYLADCTLLHNTKVKQPNGNYTLTLEVVGLYKAQIQKLTDSISATIYGADINRMYRFSSPLKELEKAIANKFNFNEDNVTNYSIKHEDKIYKIVAINDNWVDARL